MTIFPVTSAPFLIITLFSATTSSLQISRICFPSRSFSSELKSSFKVILIIFPARTSTGVFGITGFSTLLSFFSVFSEIVDGFGSLFFFGGFDGLRFVGYNTNNFGIRYTKQLFHFILFFYYLKRFL